MKKVLIAGGAGFVGCNLCSEFIKSNKIENWKRANYSYNKRPSIFLIQSDLG